MAESTAADVQQLLQEGRAAALAGDTFAARAAFRRATELDPTSAEAWLGLSGVVPILAEKHAYLQRVLELDPGNAEAAASLRYIERLQAEGARIAPSRGRDEAPPAGDDGPPEQAAATETLHCYIHPDRETGLRCIQCGRPICGSCAKITPVGQLCPECRKLRRPANYKVAPRDAALAGFTALGIMALAGGLVTTILNFGGIFISLFLGLLVGAGLVRAVDRVTHAKRGRAMQVIVVVAAVLGAIAGAVLGVAGQVALSPEVAPLLRQMPLGALLLALLGAAVNGSLLIFTAVAAVSAALRLR